jgi:type VI secretion system secreted protein Hcp
MAHDIFLNLTGIQGESLDARHPHEIEVIEWDWSVELTSMMHGGSGAQAGKCTVRDLIFEHYVDRASVSLMKHCLVGKPIDKAVLVMRKAGGVPLEYLRLTMSNVLITNIKWIGNINMSASREHVSVSFAQIEQEYVQQNARGGAGGTIRAGFDIKSNKEI